MRCCYGLEASVAPDFLCYSPNAHHDGIWRSGLWEVRTMRLSHENGGRARRPCPGACSRSLFAHHVRTQPEGGHQARKRTLTGNQRGRHLMLDVSSEAQRGFLLSVKQWKLTPPGGGEKEHLGKRLLSTQRCQVSPTRQRTLRHFLWFRESAFHIINLWAW